MTPGEADFGKRFSVSGALSARQAASLSARVDGLVSKVHIDAGDFVVQGDILFAPGKCRLAACRTWTGWFMKTRDDRAGHRASTVFLVVAV